MSRKLPSPIALRSFEAAARNLSFTRAAQELFVTQSAVSHQVRGLERELGVRLFLRLTRQLRLTEAGDALLTVVRDGFDRIEETVEQIKVGSGAHPLRVGLTSYFAARWFTRRLGRFSAPHPEVEIHLQLTNGDIDFKRSDLDLAIIWGHGEWSDLEAWQLMPLRITAVCSPGLLKNGPTLTHASDVRHHPLLHESGRGLWPHYLAKAGSPGVHSERNVVMDDPNVLHQACLDGQGIALGAEALLADELDRGSLVRPFVESVPLGGYYVVRPSHTAARRNVAAFEQWLREEAGGPVL